MSVSHSRPTHRRVITALFAALVMVAATTVGVSLPGVAHAQTSETPPETSVIGGSPRPGDKAPGELATAPGGQHGVVAPGGLLTVRGTGFAERPADGGFLAFKINDGAAQFPSAGQPADVDEVDGSGTAYFRGAKLPDAETGAFSGQIRLPENIQPGWYWVRLLSGSDGGSTLSKFAWFKVDENAGEPGDPDDPGDDDDEPDTSPKATPGTVTAAGDVVNVPLTVENYVPGANLTATLGGDTAKFVTGAIEADSIVLNADGRFTGTLRLPAGELKAGERKWLTVSDDEGTSQSFVVTGVPSTEFINWQTQRPDTSIGAQVDVTVGNLPAGATVAGVGAGGRNWAESEPVTAGEDGTATALNVRIPNVAVGTPIIVTVSMNGESTPYASGKSVTAATGPVNESSVEKTCVPVPAGTGSVEYGASGNALYLARLTASGSEILKLDASTMATIGRVAVSQDFPVDKLAVDEGNHLLWATNPVKGTIAAYNTSDLSLAKQNPAGSSAGVREIEVDKASHKVFVTKETSPYGEVDIYDGNDLDRGKTGSVRIDNFGATGPIDVNQENGDVFVASTERPRAVRISARNGSNAVETHYRNELNASWSAIAYDPVQWNIWLAGRTSSEITVLDAPGKDVVNTVSAGTRTTDLHVDSKNHVVYAASQGSGTVSVFDSVTLQRRAVVPIGAGAGALTGDAAGNTFVVTQSTGGVNTLCKLSPTTVPHDDGHSEGSLGNVTEQILGPGSTGSTSSADEATGNLGSLAPIAALGIGALGIGAIFAIQEGLKNSRGALPPELQRIFDAVFA